MPEFGRKPYLDEEGLSHPQRMRRVTATHMRNAAGGDQTDLRKPYRSTGNFLTRFHRPILPVANFPLSNPKRQMPEFEGPAPINDPKWNTAPPTIEFSGEECISPTTFTADYPLTIKMTTGFETKTWVKQIHIPCGWGKYGVLESENRPIIQEIDVGFGFSYTTNLHLCDDGTPDDGTPDDGIPACDCDTMWRVVFNSDNRISDPDPEYGACQIVAGVPSLWLVAGGCPPFHWEILKGAPDVTWDMETTIGRENILIPSSPLDPAISLVEIRVTDNCGDQTQLLRREVCVCGVGQPLRLYRYPHVVPDHIMAYFSKWSLGYGCTPMDIKITPGKRWPDWDFTCYNVEYDDTTEEYYVTNYVPDGTGIWYCANGGCDDKVYYPKWKVPKQARRKTLPDGSEVYANTLFWPKLMNYQASMAWRVHATDGCGNTVERLYATTRWSYDQYT